MIPEREGESRPPLSFAFVFMLAAFAPILHLLSVTVLSLIGFRGTLPVAGMGAVLAYGGVFTVCAVRFREPPLKQLSLVRAPTTAWLAVAFLVSSVVLTSEIDNLVKAMFPVPSEFTPATEPVELPPFWGSTLAVVQIAVFPLAYELFFRGILQPLAVLRFGIVGGIALTAMLSGFASGLVFGGLWGIAPAFANSLVLGVLRQASGSLWPPIALHALTGLVTVAAMYQAFGLAGFDDVTAAHTPPAWLAGAALLSGVGFGLLRAAARDAEDPAGPPRI